MASQVNPPSIHGLSPFSPPLAAFAADNLAPCAVIQLENLGESFLVSGEHAAKVPEYLCRAFSVPIAREALSVGWRKGDTVEIMAGSAGGRAIALLSMSILQIHHPADAGKILFELGQVLLPRCAVTSSILELLAVAELLRGKLQALAFGNELARLTTKFSETYKRLGSEIPGNLLDPISPDTMVELLENMSKALMKENNMLTISGTRSLCNILGLTLLMFPEDTLVTIDGHIFHEGLRRSILLSFEKVERPESSFNIASHPSDFVAPLRFIKAEEGLKNLKWRCSFTWMGWVKNWLQLQFLSFGLHCPSDLLQAISDVVLHMAGKLYPGYDWIDPDSDSVNHAASPHKNWLNGETWILPSGVLDITQPQHFEQALFVL